MPDATSAATPAATPVFGLLAGGGTLPGLLCRAAQARQWPVHVITFSGQPQPEALPRGIASTASFALGAVGKVIEHLKKSGVTHVAMAGNLSKPSLFTLKPDAKGLAMLARAARTSGNHHDDALLRIVTETLSEHGFHVLSTTDLAPGLLAAEGILTEVQPTPDDIADVALALTALEAMGRLDIGQAAVVHGKTILGLEAVEGTDALIARCAALRGEGQGGQKHGILVKVAKPGQTHQADLPTVGPQTIRNLARHGYRGLAVQAGATLILSQEETMALARKYGLLVLGVAVPWSTD